MMRLLQKIGTAMRGSAREGLEVVVDANAFCIFEQEIYEAEGQLREAKQHLAQVVADKLKLAREIKALQQQIAKQESIAREQLAADDETGAMQTATVIAEQEARLERMQQSHDELLTYETRLLATLKTTGQKLESYRAELRMAKATQHSQQVMGKLSQHRNQYSDTFANMQDSLERIRGKQQDFSDRMDAMQHIDEQLLGTPDATDNSTRTAAILNRLKTRTA